MTKNSSNGQLGMPASIAFGGVFFLVGSLILMLAADIIHADPSSFNAPRWVVGAAGGVFMISGTMVAIQGSFGPDGMQTKLYLWLQFFFSLALLSLFSAVALWIGFGSDEIEFTTSTTIGPITTSSTGNNKMGSFVFGASGVVMVIITIVTAISQLRKIFKE